MIAMWTASHRYLGARGFGAMIRSMRRWVLLGALAGLTGCREEHYCAATPAIQTVAEPRACAPGCRGGTAPECAPPCGRQLEFEWLVELDEAPCWRGPVIAAELDGLILVAGGAQTDPSFEQRWVATLSQTGCVKDIEIDGEAAFGAEGLVLAIAAHPDHGAYAVGKQEIFLGNGTSYESHVWIRRYATDGTVAWTVEERAATDEVASGVAIDADGSAIVVGGTASFLGQGWLRRYGADGTRVDRWILSDPLPTHVLDVSVSSTGQRWISGWTADDRPRPPSVSNSSSGFVAALHSTDAVRWSAPITSMTSARLVSSGTAPILVGPRSSVARWNADGEEEWTTSLELRRIDPIRGHVMADGSILIVGSRHSKPVLALLGPDGALVGTSTVPGFEVGEVSDASVSSFHRGSA